MAGDLERALSKLRFDDQVIGYSLMTKMGRPFVSFSFPDDLFPRVKESISLYKADLRLMTIDTDKGLVVLAPVDDNWILTVLYVPELQLGLAIAKTKNVLRMLEGIELPPPPDEFEESAESNLEVLESIAIQAASTAAEPSAAPTAAPAAPEPEELSPDDFLVTSSTVPTKGEAFSTALSLDSELYSEMKKLYRNFGFDVLMLVDGRKTVGQIADSMFQPTEKVIDLLKWAASKRVVEVPRVDASGEGAPARGLSGRFVKCPKFEGDLSKVRADHVKIVQLCDGTKTTEEIAESVGVPVPRVIQVLAMYRKRGMKMIGKTL
ncbi:MAG: hypothetical protein ACP6IT_10195 [Candidatus Thorarchaeota archaeon]